jgi:hypothetical protein
VLEVLSYLSAQDAVHLLTVSDVEHVHLHIRKSGVTPLAGLRRPAGVQQTPHILASATQADCTSSTATLSWCSRPQPA